MDIFNYHPTTHEFLSSEEAELDELDQLPLIPAFATEIPSPVVAAGNIAVFTGSDWDEVEDNRGVVYDINTLIPSAYTTFGPLPVTLTKLVPESMDIWNGSAWVNDFTKSVKLKQSEIKTTFNSKLSIGFETSISTIKMDAYNTNILDFDGGVRLAEKQSQTNIQIRDFDNNLHTVSTTNASIMVTELGNNYQTLLEQKWDLQEQANQASNQSELDAIVWI